MWFLRLVGSLHGPNLSPFTCQVIYAIALLVDFFYSFRNKSISIADTASFFDLMYSVRISLQKTSICGHESYLEDARTQYWRGHHENNSTQNSRSSLSEIAKNYRSRRRQKESNIYRTITDCFLFISNKLGRCKEAKYVKLISTLKRKE